MQNFIKCFRRDGSGTWECIAPARLELPGGRIEVAPGTVFVRGTRFMNIDLAELLETQYQKNRDR